MKINTTRFGEIEINESSIFELTSPILGYEKEDKYVLVEHNDNSKFKWFQSIKTPELAFAVTFPGSFGIDYVYELPENVQEELKIETVGDILTLNIVLIPHENPRHSTINLLAPLIFNINTKKGAQVILTGTNFNVRHPLFTDNENEAKC